MNIGKDRPEVSVSNTEKRDSPAIAHNTMKTTAPTISNHNRGNINNEGRDVYLPSKPLPNTLKTKELISLSPEYKSWTHENQKRPPHSQTTLLKRHRIFFTAEGNNPIPSVIKPRNVHNVASLFAMTQYQITKHFTIPVEINGVINLKAMLNTGATANFIHRDLVKKHRIQTIPQQNPLTTKDVHGRILAIVNEQAIFRLWIRSHIETIIMDIMPTRQHSLILGMPWMETHDPWIRITDKDLM